MCTGHLLSLIAGAHDTPWNPTSLRNSRGELPLHIAAAHNFMDCLELLISEGDLSNINELNDDGSSPLHVALRHNAAEASLALIQKQVRAWSGPGVPVRPGVVIC